MDYRVDANLYNPDTLPVRDAQSAIGATLFSPARSRGAVFEESRADGSGLGKRGRRILPSCRRPERSDSESEATIKKRKLGQYCKGFPVTGTWLISYTYLVQAPYALTQEKSRGRRYPEPGHAYRSDFQRDRDRVVHSRSFRRLENKTQVFTRRYSDHFRNRLTHTIEVAQISRTIAAELGLNEDLVEALALVHDVGHPPFGHSGEKALDAIMRRHGDLFDHNLHALRIVEQFEQRYADFPGMNLTFEVREGIVKHSRDYSPAEFPQLAEYLLDQRPPLEAQLIDLTDEIAYSTADLDDGVEALILTREQVRESVPIFARAYDEVEQRYPQASEKLKFNEALKRVLDRMVSDLIDHARARIQAAGIETVDDVRRHAERLFAFSPEMDADRRHLKAFLYKNLYYSPGLLGDKSTAEQTITELFEFFLTSPGDLPGGYHEKSEQEPLHRVVCDYIAGMTDSYVQQQHRMFLGHAGASR